MADRAAEAMATADAATEAAGTAMAAAVTVAEMVTAAGAVGETGIQLSARSIYMNRWCASTSREPVSGRQERQWNPKPLFRLAIYRIALETPMRWLDILTATKALLTTSIGGGIRKCTG